MHPPPGLDDDPSPIKYQSAAIARPGHDNRVKRINACAATCERKKCNSEVILARKFFLTIEDSTASFRGAPKGASPGIQKHRDCLLVWIPGSLAIARRRRA